MTPDEVRWEVLEYLYKCYREHGKQLIGTAQIERDLDRSHQDLILAFQELVEDQLAVGHARRGTGKIGLIRISQLGRQAIEDSRLAPPPPPIVHMVIAGFTPDAHQQFLELFAQINAKEQAQFKQLLNEIQDQSRPEEDRIAKAEKLVSLVQNSTSLVTALIGPHAPQAMSFLSQILNR